MKPKRNSPFYLIIVAFHTLTTSLAAYASLQLNAAPNFKHLILGSALGLGNILLIVWSIRRAERKKSFALVAVTSVFKYGFLIFLFWYAMQTQQRVGYEFVIGVTLIFPTVVLMAYLMKNENENDGTF